MSLDLDAVAAQLKSAPKETFNRKEVEAEINHWFFDVYLRHWVAVGKGERDEGPEFILQYWGTPMYATNDKPEFALWLNTDEQVVKFLTMQHQLLQEAGYSHTEVPDKSVRAYNSSGGAIEVIWSRRSSDNTEIQRFVVHFEVVKFGDTWKVVGVQSRGSDASKDGNTLEGAWAL